MTDSAVGISGIFVCRPKTKNGWASDWSLFINFTIYQIFFLIRGEEAALNNNSTRVQKSRADLGGAGETNMVLVL